MDWLIMLAILGGVILVVTLAGLVPIVLLKVYLGVLAAIVVIWAAVKIVPEAMQQRGGAGGGGRPGDARDALAGREGESVTALRPAGFVEIDGERYAARSELGYIDAGRPVRVMRWETGTAIVRERGS